MLLFLEQIICNIRKISNYVLFEVKIFNIREKEYNYGIKNVGRIRLAISILTHSFTGLTPILSKL